jgi:multimeric flavodoxin WrbA/protein-tyrosine-phosphatase
MLVLGLQGSPRKKGNTNYMMALFMEEAARLGLRTKTIDVTRKHIQPCKELVVCERKGFCPIDDDMRHEIYGLLRRAEVVVISSPVFFYNVTAQLKALIDRSQTLWARKYKLKLKDPAHKQRQGFMLAAGATGGKNLFEGLNLTANYFFDAIDARFAGSLVYRQIEGPKDMQEHPTVRADTRKAVNELLAPLVKRKRILFAGRQDVCRSQMAAALTQLNGGDRFDVSCGGSRPAETVSPEMVKVMQAKGIDMAFRTPRSAETAVEEKPPDIIVNLGYGKSFPSGTGAEIIEWDLPEPAGLTVESLHDLYDEIENRVIKLIQAC